MSKLIAELVGRKCIMECENGHAIFGVNKVQCTILDADNEWIKVSYAENPKKPEIKTKIIRIEEISRIEVEEKEA